MYVPKRSSWGVFERPADISKTYGGGRVLSKDEMDAMDARFEQRQARKDKAVEQWKTKGMKAELEHAGVIKAALNMARGCVLSFCSILSVAASFLHFYL